MPEEHIVTSFAGPHELTVCVNITECTSLRKSCEFHHPRIPALVFQRDTLLLPYLLTVNEQASASLLTCDRSLIFSEHLNLSAFFSISFCLLCVVMMWQWSGLVMTSLLQRADSTSLKLPPREEKHERAVVNRGSSRPCTHKTHMAQVRTDRKT